MRDVGEDLALERLGKDGGTLRAAGRAKPSAFAGKGDEKLVGAAGTLDAGEAGFDNARPVSAGRKALFT